MADKEKTGGTENVTSEAGSTGETSAGKQAADILKSFRKGLSEVQKETKKPAAKKSTAGQDRSTGQGQRTAKQQSAGNTAAQKQPAAGQTNQAPRKKKPMSPERRKAVQAKRRRARRIRLAKQIGVLAAALLVIILIIVGLVKVISDLGGKKTPGSDPVQVSSTQAVVTTEAVTELETEAGAGTEEVTEEPTTAEPTTETPATDPEPEVETVYATTVLNVREAPSTDAAALGKLQAGEAVQRVANENGWSTIIYNGQTAYASSDFLTTGAEETPAATTAAATVSIPEGGWDLNSLDDTMYNFGFSEANRDPVTNIPTDWAWYESQWGQFNVDWIQDTSQPVIYLTMDEGFGNDETITILDILAEKQVQVVFFLTEYFIDERPELVQRMINEGHILGDHSCTHPDMTSISLEQATAEITTVRDKLLNQFGYDVKLFRFPEGKYSARTLGLVDNLGMKSVFWDYAYIDYNVDNQPPVDESLQKALDALCNGAIYLLHARSSTNVAILSDFIDGARARGYTFGSYPLTAN